MINISTSGVQQKELGDIPPYIYMEYQQKLMKELEERLWTVDRFLVDRSWDYPVYCSLAPFLYKTMS